jgi:hypothetical protein
MLTLIIILLVVLVFVLVIIPGWSKARYVGRRKQGLVETLRYQLLVRHRIQQWWFYRNFSRGRAHGCQETSCTRGNRQPHASCVDCGRRTHSRQMRTDPNTLQRQLRYVCDSCYWDYAFSGRGDQVNSERARRDWKEVTDPIINGALHLGEMPEQLPGPTRAALRAFYESTETKAVVPDVSAGTLNNSLATLGLADSMYAETRGQKTVLRKVERPTKSRKASN